MEAGGLWLLTAPTTLLCRREGKLRGWGEGPRSPGPSWLHLSIASHHVEEDVDTAPNYTKRWATEGSPILTAEPMQGAPGGREALLGRKHLPIHHESWKRELTGVDKAPRSTFTELLGFVGQGDFHDSRNVPRWGLDSDGVGSDQL